VNAARVQNSDTKKIQLPIKMNFGDKIFNQYSAVFIATALLLVVAVALFRCKTGWQDSAGAGRHRGGLDVERVRQSLK
jgi:hypothetical protein